MDKKNDSCKKGQSLVELLLVIVLSSLILPTLITGLVSSRGGRAQQEQRLQAITYLKETAEALRNVRENGWDVFSINGIYHPVISGSSWALASGSESINGFTRQVVISDVYRDQNGAIVSTGGTLDPSTKKGVITVSWSTPFSSSIQSTLYLTRYLDNITFVDTSEADFNAGTKTGVTVTNTSGGEVILGSGGQGLWCTPNLSISALDLPKNGVANSVTAIEGRAFAGTGDNASGISFANISIRNTNPPNASIAGTYDCCKTNDVFGELNYAYLATDTNSKEVVIVNLATNPYSEAGYFNIPGNTNANSVFVVGDTGYTTAENKLYNFDLSSKSGSRPARDPNGVQVSVLGEARELYIVGNYAYVTIGNYALIELVIVDLSDPNNLRVVGWANVNGASGQEVYVNSSGTRAYLATSADPSKSEFFVIDTSTKTGTRPTIGSYEANGMNPKGVTVVTGNKAILVGTGAEEYQVIDITNENSPSRCGGLNVDAGINEVSSVLESDGDAYSYIVTGDAAAEFKIIEGGPGGQYASSGTFESRTFDPGAQTTNYNRFIANISKPSQTDIALQVAVADTVGGSCTGVSYPFVGPDKTSNTFFTSTNGTTIEGQIPADNDGTGFENPGRCFRYKAFLSTTDSSQTPVLYDITVNYSP